MTTEQMDWLDDQRNRERLMQLAQQPKPPPCFWEQLWHEQPSCQCGDYVAQHENGNGKCIPCSTSGRPWDRCRKYRPSLANRQPGDRTVPALKEATDV